MSEATTQAAAYDLIDRFLRNNLYDDDYAKYSEALEALSQPAPSPRPSAPVGPKCRDCADFGPICPNSGKPCNSQPQPAVPVVSDEQILETAREWSNSNFVAGSERFLLDFARALLALRPAVEPMTDEQRDYVSVPISLIRRAQNAINWHLEPNSPDEHEATMLELTAIGWPNGGPGITAKAEGGA